ncbi:MAG TPA: PAS domain S-box protein, partial [Acidobacteriota bacterium]
GRFLDVNDRGCLEHGYTREEYLSLTIFDIDPLVSPARFVETLSELRKSGAMLWRGAHKRKDGSVFPVEVNIRYVRFDRDYLVAMVRDITKRVKAEEELRKSEERYRTLAEGAQDDIFIVGCDDTILYLNTHAAKSLRVTPEQIIGKSRSEIFTPQSYTSQTKSLQKVIKTMAPNRVEEAMQLGGKQVWMDINLVPLKDPLGTVVAVMGIARDITDRKNAERALQDAEENYRNIFDNAVEGIFQTTPEGRFLRANGSLALMFGYESPADLVNSLDDLQHKLYVKQNRRAEVKEALEQLGHVYALESEVFRKNGDKIWISENIRAVRDAEGRILHYEGTIEDITKRKRAEEALHDSMQQLLHSQKMEA